MSEDETDRDRMLAKARRRFVSTPTATLMTALEQLDATLHHDPDRGDVRDLRASRDTLIAMIENRHSDVAAKIEDIFYQAELTDTDPGEYVPIMRRALIELDII